jgi:hypothetical protein
MTVHPNLVLYVGSKAKSVWIWLALERQTRKIVGSAFGDCSEKACVALWSSFPADYRKRALCITDGLSRCNAIWLSILYLTRKGSIYLKGRMLFSLILGLSLCFMIPLPFSIWYGVVYPTGISVFMCYDGIIDIEN